MNLNKIIRMLSKYGGKLSYLEYIIRDVFQKPRGSVRAVIEENGISWVAHEQNNLIVNLARPAMAGLLAEADTDYVVDNFKIGTQGHTLGPPEDIVTPVAPAVTDTSLIDVSPFSKAISSFSYLPGGTPTSVQFVSVLEKSEANGSGSVTYTEAGLFMNGGNMFARETFAAIVKNSSRKVTFFWVILF
jgi:hypothetical protein